LSPAQKDLRAFYARLLALVGEPAFRDGECFRLNYANAGHHRFGRLAGETASGHWLYAYLRFDAASGQRVLVLTNLHPSETMHDVEVRLPREAVAFLQVPADQVWKPAERLMEQGTEISMAWQRDATIVLSVDAIPSLTPFYFELTSATP
jgi:hypothetical protein